MGEVYAQQFVNGKLKYRSELLPTSELELNWHGNREVVYHLRLQHFYPDKLIKLHEKMTGLDFVDDIKPTFVPNSPWVDGVHGNY
jgi:hypothetical protein